MLEETNDNLPMADGQTEIESTENATELSAQEVMDNHLAEASEEGSLVESKEIPQKDYEALSMEALVEELAELVSHENIMVVKNHIEDIKKSFLSKYHQFIDEKRAAFYTENESSVEFDYHFPLKSKFDQLYDTYKAKRTKHFNQIQNQLKDNYATRTTLIEELKALIDNGETNMSDMFKKFNDIRERWKNAGAIPRDKYNLLWNNYHFHTDRFYELVHLDKEIRDADFKNNLEQKVAIIEKAKTLLAETDLTKAFRELQVLHKIWK